MRTPKALNNLVSESSGNYRLYKCQQLYLWIVDGFIHPTSAPLRIHESHVELVGIDDV